MKRIAAACMIGMCFMLIPACGKAEIEPENTSEYMDVISTEHETAYWLCGTGIPDGPDYTGGICEAYFKSNSMILKGSFLKSMSLEDYGKQIGTIETLASEEFEVSSNCKVIQDEGNDAKIYPYPKYIEDYGISETDNAAGIYMAITINNGKVTEIYYSS